MMKLWEIVIYLKRTEFGNLTLEGMNLGDVKEINGTDNLIQQK